MDKWGKNYRKNILRKTSVSQKHTRLCECDFLLLLFLCIHCAKLKWFGLLRLNCLLLSFFSEEDNLTIIITQHICDVIVLKNEDDSKIIWSSPSASLTQRTSWVSEISPENWLSFSANYEKVIPWEINKEFVTLLKETKIETYLILPRTSADVTHWRSCVLDTSSHTESEGASVSGGFETVAHGFRWWRFRLKSLSMYVHGRYQG